MAHYTAFLTPPVLQMMSLFNKWVPANKKCVNAYLNYKIYFQMQFILCSIRYAYQDETSRTTHRGRGKLLIFKYVSDAVLYHEFQSHTRLFRGNILLGKGLFSNM